ncbi:DUF3099 domain-containing protein [Klugiella xanthotipulae]|nr:DUF3099 domain-containing protein [Klugiella xanthotipulae]
MKPSQSVTYLSSAPADDRSSRMLKYSVMMGIRFACIIAIPFMHGWWMVVPILGAVFMPYFAVVIANVSGVGKRATPESPVDLSLESAAIPLADTPPIIIVDEPFASPDFPAVNSGQETSTRSVDLPDTGENQ